MHADYRKHNDGSHNSSTYHKKDGTPVRQILAEDTRHRVEEFLSAQDDVLDGATVLGMSQPQANSVIASLQGYYKIQDYDDDAAEDRINRFHDGYWAHKRGEARPNDPHAAAGWDDRARDQKVRVIMPARPEGYYHAKPGTFD